MPKRNAATTGDLFAYAKDNRPSIVYMATNAKNGKRYIGITRQGLERRKRQHINAAIRGASHCVLLCRAIRLDGPEAFAWEVLEHCGTYKAAAAREIELIATLGPEYNISAGGDGVAGVGFRFTQRATRKRAKAPPTRYWLGKKRPDIAENQRKRLSENPMRYWKGKKRPEAAVQKMRETMMERRNWESEASKVANYNRRKTVICLNDGQEYRGARDVAETLGLNYRSVTKVLSGARQQLHGLRFKYKDAS